MAVAQRDERGRFIKGNTIAKGNKGNTKSKWGNQNAIKHGRYSYYKGLSFHNGILYVMVDSQSVGVLSKDDYYIKDRIFYNQYGNSIIVKNQIFIKKELANLLVNKYKLREKSFHKTVNDNYRLFVNYNRASFVIYYGSIEKDIIRV